MGLLCLGGTSHNIKRKDLKCIEYTQVNLIADYSLFMNVSSKLKEGCGTEDLNGITFHSGRTP